MPVAAYELLSSTELLDKMAMEKMLTGLSTRRYAAGKATSKSAVSRRFVAMTEHALADLLTAAVKEVFDHPVIQGCQLHKVRNVKDHLPERLRGPVEAKMRQAYHADSGLAAQGQLEALANELTAPIPAPRAAA